MKHEIRINISRKFLSHCLPITRTSRLVFLKEIISDSSKNHTKHTDNFYGKVHSADAKTVVTQQPKQCVKGLNEEWR